MITEINDYIDNYKECYQNGTEEDKFKSVIADLYSDKLKLLKEQKILYNLLADKDDQILKMTEFYKRKFQLVVERLRNIDRSYIDFNDEKSIDLRLVTSQRLPIGESSSSSLLNMESSVSSCYTVITDTHNAQTTQSTLSSASESSESIVANHNCDTLTKFPGCKSLNSLLSENTHYLAPKEEKCNNLQIDQQTFRSHSDCIKDSNDFINRKSGIETDTSESLFRIAEDNIRRSKKLTKKANNNKSEKPNEILELKCKENKPFSEFSNEEVSNWLLNFARLPKFLVEEIKIKNKINGQTLDQVTEQKFDKWFGTSDKLIKRKVLLAIEEYKSAGYTGKIESNNLSSKDPLWVANIWLKKHLGLKHLSAVFLARCIDGKLLRFIASSNHTRMKELINLATINYESSSGVLATPINFVNRAIHEPSKSDLRSLRFGLQLLIKFDFDISELEKRRVACEDINTDVLVWTNERFVKWFQQQNLKNYLRGIEYSGIHGGLMVLDPNFSVSSMFKLMQMPSEVAKKSNLEEKLSILLKPSRFNEGVKNRRSSSLFRRRSLSQPRHSKNIAKNRTTNVTPDISDSASNNDSMTLTVRTNYKEKCQTIDLSHSPSKNQNFIRTYRKPDQNKPKINVTDIDLEEVVQNNTKPPSPKLSLQFPIKSARRLKEKGLSGSENDDDYEI